MEIFFDVHCCRDRILALSRAVSELCTAVHAESDPIQPLARLLFDLTQVAEAACFDLQKAIREKLKINRLKYPVHLCKVL